MLSHQNDATAVQAWFKAMLNDHELCEKLKKIKFIISDVDGCLTPANIMLMDSGDEGKDFSVQDGYVIHKSLQEKLLSIGLLTGRNSPSTAARAQRLGIAAELCVMGVVEEKKASVVVMQNLVGATYEQTLFFGDDAQDYNVRPVVSLFASPANAVFYVYQKADIQLPLVGGHGAFRLLLDLILYVQNKHFCQDLISEAVHTSV